MLFHLTAAKQSVLEELNQEVWLSAIRSIDRFDASKGNAVDWVLGIARNKGLTFLRRLYASRVVCVGGSNELPESIVFNEDQILVTERAALLRVSLESLPKNWQFVLQNKYHLGLSVREIAELMRTTPKAIESTLSRARQRLRDLMRASTEEL